MRHAVRNGLLIDEKDALVPMTMREVQSSVYVYEALRVTGGHAVHLGDHITRLRKSAEGIGLSLGDHDWGKWISLLLASDSVSDATVRITVYGGSDELSFVTWQPLLTYPDVYYTEGVKTITYEGERYLPRLKTGNLLLNYMAREKAEGEGAFEALLVDRNGKVLEGSRSNFYALRGNTVYTAPDGTVLDGITRKSVLRAIRDLEMDVVMEAPDASSIFSFDALFISSTSMGAMPVSHVDGGCVAKDNSTVAAICALVRKWETEE